MKPIRVVVVSLCVICCIGWSLNSIAAKYDPLVEKAQQRLTELGYNPGPVDGKMGPKTIAAIKQFQQDQGLVVTGELDEETGQKLGILEPKQPQVTPTPDLKDAEAYKSRGLAYLNKGDYDRAIEEYTQAIALNPEDAIAYNNRGSAYLNKKEYDRAIEDYTQAVTLNPEYAIAYNNRGFAYLDKGDYDHAIEDYTQTITLNPEDAIAYNNRGLAYWKRGDYNHAIEDCTKAVTLNPKLTGAYNVRGLAYADKGGYDRAIEDYTQAVTLNPKLAVVYSNRGLAYANKGEYDRAIEDYTEAITLKPEYAMAYNNRGIAYDHKGQREQAIEDFKKACDLGIEQACKSFASIQEQSQLEEKPLSNQTTPKQDTSTAEELSLEQFWEEFTSAFEANDAKQIQQLIRANPDTTEELQQWWEESGTGTDENAQQARALGKMLKNFRADNFKVIFNRLNEQAQQISDDQLALKTWLYGLEQAKALNDREYISMFLTNIGVKHIIRGEDQQALEYLEQGLTIARESRDRDGEGTALSNIATVYLNQGKDQQALDTFEQALTIAREIDDREKEGHNLGNIGTVYTVMGQPEKALVYYEQALEIASETRNGFEMVANLHNIGRVSKDLGQYQKALDYYEQALEIYKAIGDRSGEESVQAEIEEIQQELSQSKTVTQEASKKISPNTDKVSLDSLNKEGTQAYDASDYPSALEKWQEGLDLARTLGDKLAISAFLGNLGVVHNVLGQYQQALEYYEQALVIHRETGNLKWELNTLGSLGEVYENLEQYQQALEYYKQALLISRKIGDHRGEGNFLSNIALTYGKLQQHQEALGYFEKSLLIRREIGDRRGEGYDLSNIGATYGKLQQYQEALEYLEQALAIRQEVGDRRGEGDDLSNLGFVYWVLGQYQQALDCYEQAQVIFKELGVQQRAESIQINIDLVQQQAKAGTHETLKEGIFEADELSPLEEGAEAYYTPIPVPIEEPVAIHKYANVGMAFVNDGNIILVDSNCPIIKAVKKECTMINTGLRGEDPWLSSDGTKLAYRKMKLLESVKPVSPENSQYGQTITNSGIYLLDLPSDKEIQISEQGSNPRISPDNTMVAYEFDGTIYVVNVSDKKTQRIDQGANPVWLGNNRLLYEKAFQVMQYSLPQNNSTILYEAPGETITSSRLKMTMALTSGKTINAQSSLYSFADGEKAAFLQFEASTQIGTRHSIIIVDEFRKNEQYLVEVQTEQQPLNTVSNLAVSPDGSKAAFVDSDKENNIARIFYCELSTSGDRTSRPIKTNCSVVSGFLSMLTQFASIGQLTFWDDYTLLVETEDINKRLIPLSDDAVYLVSTQQLAPADLRMMELDESIADADSLYFLELNSKTPFLFSSGHGMSIIQIETDVKVTDLNAQKQQTYQEYQAFYTKACQSNGTPAILVATENVNLSQQVKDNISLGLVIHQNSFTQPIKQFEELRDQAKLLSDPQSLQTIEMVLRELENIRDVAVGKKVMINCADGYLFHIGLPSVPDIENGFQEYGFRLPDSGWEPGPTFGAIPISQDEWEEAKKTRISSGKWAGAYKYGEDQIVLPGLQCFSLDLPSKEQDSIGDTSTSIVRRRVHPKDGAIMLLIPAGPFAFGYLPKGIEIGAYWIDKYEVTNAQYAKFVAETGHTPPQHWNGKTPPQAILDHPVVNVSWDDATAYAKWAGKRLPTVEEWEKAARGSKDIRNYPWGDDRNLLFEYAQVGEGTSPVGSHPQGASPYGVEDMIGNVAEWTASEFLLSTKITRGGGWDSGAHLIISPIADGGSPSSATNDNRGFRCAMDADQYEGGELR